MEPDEAMEHVQEWKRCTHYSFLPCQSWHLPLEPECVFGCGRRWYHSKKHPWPRNPVICFLTHVTFPVLASYSHWKWWHTWKGKIRQPRVTVFPSKPSLLIREQKGRVRWALMHIPGSEVKSVELDLCSVALLVRHMQCVCVSKLWNTNVWLWWF